MNRHFTLSKALMAILLFLGIALGQSAFAQTTWSLQPTSSGNTITYKVKRSGDISQAVTVRYRTVGLSSYEGENFTSANGTLTFPAGIDEKTVTVTSQTPSTEAYKYYQSGATRKYLFEVTDMGGFSLVSKEDNAGAGTVFNTSYLNQSVTDLVYFTYNGAIQSGDGNKYVDASHSGSSDWVQVTDGGYDQAVHTISTNSLYNNNSTSSSFRNYLNEIGYKMYATVYFTQKEEQDGYQYIQILTDNSSTYDGDDPDGAVNAPSTSLYKACFILSYNPSGSVMSDPHYQFFPHRYDYIDRAAEQTAGISHYEFDYDNSHLYQQRFKATSYQSNTSGSLVLAPTVNNLNVRFDAAGSGGDTWDFKNLKVRLALVDATKPTIRNNNDIRVADGAYGYGNTVYITIPFTEIVTVTGTPTLSTTWGTLNYIAGSGTNVLTFSGHIQADLGTVLTVNSIGGTSFTIKDLMGNAYNNTSISKTFSGLQVTNPWTGSGTANDPYIIMDSYQLNLLSKLVWAGNYYENKYFKLGANITYSSSTSWSSTSSFTSNFTSIGGWGHSFRGVFDGDGHSISGIRIYTSGTTDNDQCQGLFGYASSATVKNLVLYDVNIVGYKQVGAIAGSQTYGTFQDCYIYNTRVAATSGTQQEVIAGSISGGTRDRIYFKNCKIGNNTGQHNIVKLTLTNDATVTRTPVTTVNSTLTTYSDGATISGEEYYSPDATITLGYSGSVPSGSFVKYTASTSTGDITFTNIDGNVLTMPDADVTVSAAILPVVDYLDADGNAHQCSDYTLITSSTSDVELGASGKTHWYVVSSDATINAMLKFTDATANLILCNGTTLNVNRTNSGSAVFANNLNIFGQTNGNGTLNATVSNGSGISSNALGIYGGIVSASGGDYGINAGGNSITLGYTAAANRVTASSYLCNSLTVKAGQTLTDGEGHIYSGTYTGNDLNSTLTALAGKTLQPAYSITLPANFTVTGTTAAQGYAPAGETVTLHTDEGYTITAASYTPEGGSATTITPVEGVWSFTMPTANTTVSATRIINTYTVHFDANATNGIDVTGTMEDMDFTYGQAQNLTTNVFERTGYTFTGWNTAADGSGDAYTDGQNVNNLTNVLNGVVTLYAQWSIIPWQGNGTSENNPYIIIYASQLVKLSEDVNGGNGYSNKFFKLGNDIDMDGVAFDGIGSSSARSFGGTFNGDGKTVSNVIVNKSEQNYVGFFGYVYYGTVRNLILDGVSISGYQYVGALVGYGGYNCSIENCLVMNSSVTYTNRNYIGVICGSPNEVSLTGNHYRNCTCNNTQTTNIGVGAFTNSNDVDGARSIHTLALPEHVTATSTDMLTYDNVTYYASNVQVTLTPAQGITLADVTVNGVAATHQQDETWTFTMPATDATVTASASVPYIDADGNQQTCSSYTVIESSDNSVALGTDGQDGWYVVSGNVTITGQLWLKGTNNHLILCDGASLTINHAMQNAVGFYVANDNLYIYGQSAGSGTATITITSPGSHGIQSFGGNITINGGIISATSDMMYGIVASSGNLTINGGSVTAHGYYDGIRSGQNIIINGGTVSATNGEGNRSYGISASQDITLGFTNLTDRITASSYKAYNGTLSVKADQALYDGTAVAYSGALNNDQINAIAGKTLEPCFILTLPAHVNATGVISQTGTTAYALAGAEITLAAAEGYEITGGTTIFTMPAQDVVSDVTVQIITYNITYDLAGGTVATANPTTYNIETATFTLNNPTREHYTFAGWTGTDLDEPTMNVTITQGSIGDRSYTANWTPITYNIAYDLAGGSVATANPTTYNIETATFTLNNPTRQGYTFVGWTGTDLTEPTQTVTIAQGSIGDRTYTATWDRLERYYTFDSTTGELALIWGEFNKDNKWGDDVTADAVLSVTATDEVSFTGDCSSLFRDFTNCTSMDLSKVNTDSVTDMNNMFLFCQSLTTLDLRGWNTSNVTNMTAMFASNLSLPSIEGLSDFNTGNVTTMSSMFNGCSNLETLDLSGWNVSNVTDMNNMFCNSGLTTLDLSRWNVSNVTSMGSMFYNCSNLETLDLSGWNASKVTQLHTMFSNCTNLTTLNLSGWTLQNVIAMPMMFDGCSNLTQLDVSNWTIGSIPFFLTFSNCTGLTTLDLSTWNTSGVTNMNGMFSGCTNLTTIYVGEGWSTENVTSSDGMFDGCTSLVGGNGTTYDENHIDGEYARIDRPGRPGYLSAIPLDPVEYIDADGNTQTCTNYTLLKGSNYYSSCGDNDVEAWYVVDHDVTYSDGLQFNGSANLILVDGATLTINDDTEGDGGYMSSSDRLTIYVQSNGTGAITAVNSSISASGDLIIHGGHITLSSDNSQAVLWSWGDLTINGGEISIENGEYSCIYVSGQLTINDGTLNAVVTEEDNGYDVIYSEEDVVINGGNITVTNQGYGRGIVGDNVTINGGCVKVYIVEDYGYSGIGVDWWEGEVITLGWTDPSDLIMSQGGYDTYQLSIAPGQAFTDGEGNYFLGTYYNWDEIAALAGKTLRPFTNLDETFHITYVTNGGTLPDGYPTTYTFDETVELPVPTKENNAFAGWFDNAEFEGSPVTEIVAGTTLGDKTFYAKWMPAKTWVEYLDADGQQQRVYATVLYGIETELPGGVYTIVEDDVYFDKLSFTGNTTIILPDYKHLNVEAWGKGTNDDENGLFVNGDLTIYGQEFGDGLLNSFNVQVSGDVAIYGGHLDIGILSANNGSGTITLSWTGWDSSIRVGVYLGKVVLAKAFIDDDDNIHEAGTVADVTTINGQWLYPFITETEVSYLDENGVLQTVTATVLYGGEEAEYPGGVYTVLDMVIRGQAYYDRLHFTGDATIILPDWCSFGVAATKEDNEYWLHVDGDLTIYGQEYGNGQCLFSNVTVNGHVNVYGGWVVLYNISANEINLSWTSIQNEHMVNPTQGTTVNLLKDFMYYDDDNNRHVINAQQNVDITTIAERYLKPYAETIDVSYIDENGDTHTENATVLFGDETSLSGGTYTIINYTSFSQAVSFSGNTKLIIPDGIEVYGYYQGGGINLNVTGDLAIYGQENRSGTVLYINASVSGAVTVSNVRVIYSFINSESDILIAGGEQNYGQLSTNGIITLGYLTFNDQIFCYDYEGTVAIREGLTMINDGNGKTYTGTLTAEEVAEIENNYLYPYLTPINLEVAGYGESTESDHWVFIASPIAGSIYADNVTNLIGSMTPSGQYDYDLYRFNQSADKEWENYQQHNTMSDPFLLENGKGYLYANKNDVTLEFGGAVYLPASKEVALDYDANARLAGWNLVGNPFNAPAILDKSYYKMNPEGTGLVAEAVSGNTTIDAFTGVMVQAEGEDETVRFTKSNAKGQQETGFGTLQIALTQAGTRGNALLDNAIVSFNEGDELGKFYFGTQDANIYIPKNHKEYAIAYAGNQTEMPLNFEAHENGEYTLTISAGDVIARSEATWQSTIGYLHLIDNLTGASIDLLQTPSYTFTAHTSDYESRFRLVFAEDNLDNNDDFAFIDANGNIIINGIDGHATIQLIDLLGHVLVTKQLPTANCSLSTSDFPGGMYLLRLINGDNVKTQKIVIR